MKFISGGKLLPGHWVEEAKLLLFIKMEVTNRPLKKGERLDKAKKRDKEKTKCMERKKGNNLGEL